MVLKEKVVLVVDVPVSFNASISDVLAGSDRLYVSEPTVNDALIEDVAVDVAVVVAEVLVLAEVSIVSFEKIGGNFTFFITGAVKIVRIFSIGEEVVELSSVRLRGAVSM